MKHLVSLGPLLVLCAACCFGGGAGSSPRRETLAGLGISIEMASSHTGGASGAGYTFTSGDGSSTIEVTPAVPGAHASSRSATELLPGAVTEVQWSRPVSYAGLTGIEARVIERAPRARTHWIGAIDTSSGVVWLHLSADTAWVPGPSDGDIAWTTLRDSVRPAP